MPLKRNSVLNRCLAGHDHLDDGAKGRISRSLEAGTLVEREVKLETHSYQIVVSAGQFLRVIAKQEDYRRKAGPA